jgi:hypothetical protein
VVKLKEHGAIDWQKSLAATRLHDDTPRFESAYSIQQAEDGGYIVAGENGNFWVVKLRGDGTLNWQRTLGGTFGERAYSIQQTRDGGYIIAGESSNDDGDVSDNHGGTDFWVVKLETE